MNRVLQFLLAFVLIVATSLASADEAKVLSCGSAKITVSPARVRGGQLLIQEFLVSIVQSNNTHIIKFSPENDFLKLRCEKMQNGDFVILANHHCGGSGCSERNYSIIDLKSYKVLLSANSRQKGNQAAAELIIGKKLKPFSCKSNVEELCNSAHFE